MDPHVQYQQSLPLDTLLVGTPDPADLVSISQVPYTLLIFYLTGFFLSPYFLTGYGSCSFLINLPPHNQNLTSFLFLR